MITTTLKALREHHACIAGYNNLIRSLQGETFTALDDARVNYIRYAHKDPIPIAVILQSNGFDDALWALRAFEQTTDLVRAERMYAVWCARRVQHLMTDDRSLYALDAAERHANGDATDEELDTARDAARKAAWGAAGDAAWAAAEAEAWAAARDAAGAAARAAARAVARDAARAAARDSQKAMFSSVFCCDDAPNVSIIKQALDAMRTGSLEQK